MSNSGFGNQRGITVFETSSVPLESLFGEVGNNANAVLSTSSAQSDLFLPAYFMIRLRDSLLCPFLSLRRPAPRLYEHMFF